MRYLVIKPATWRDICRVARAMKPDHARSACAVAGSDDPLEAIQRLALAYYVGVTIWSDSKDDGEYGEPIVACGAVLNHPGVASTFMYATDRWPDVVIETTRFLRTTLRGILQKAGIRRVQTLAMAGDPTTDRWKRLLGLEYEATFHGYGKGGQDFDLFVCHLPVS